MTVLAVDLSHHNDTPNFAALRAGGVGLVLLKATEGVGYVDPVFAVRRLAARGEGLTAGFYHFARLGDPHAEAAAFLAAVGALHPGDLLALDLEVTAPGVDVVAWSTVWLSAVIAATGVTPLIYLNQSELRGHDWSPVIALGCGLWLADYDGSQAPVSSGAWPCLALKQYSDRGTTPGQPGPVDLDVFYGGPDQLAAYGYRPTPTPGDDMTPEQDARLKNIETILGGLQNAVGDPNIGILKNAATAAGDAAQLLTRPTATVTLDAGAAQTVAATLAGDARFIAALATALDAQVAKRFAAPAS